MKPAPTFPKTAFTAALTLVSTWLITGCQTESTPSARAGLAESLTFHASFDSRVDADFARGDRRVHMAPKWDKPRVLHPGLPAHQAIHLAPGQGRYGGALRFERKMEELVAFPGNGNVAYASANWNGTVSYWIRVSPDTDLAPDYCDTVQITSKDWNDAAFFTDFTKDDRPRHFRLGAMSDLKVWNPDNRDWDKMPLAEKPLVTLTQPPFSRDHWTHVLFTWENFNTGQPNGRARLYLDGVLSGEISPRVQTFTWDPQKCLIMIGLGYTGWMDDLAIFNRCLSAPEIEALRQLPLGVASLKRRN